MNNALLNITPFQERIVNLTKVFTIIHNAHCGYASHTVGYPY